MNQEKTHKLSIVLLCIDYRFWPHTLPLLEEKFGEFDLIEIAGASKNLVSPIEESDKETLLENIGISIKLHNSEQIILTNHTDCGAYGGSGKFSSRKEEEDFHRNELLKAKIIINQKFPNLKVILLIIDRNTKEEINIIEV